MADVVIMPKLGFDMSEGTLVHWVKKEGEGIEKGQLLAEIETDKATVEVESMYSGTVRKLLVTEGTVVPVNTAIAIVGTADEELDLDALLGDQKETEAGVPKKETASDEPPPEPAEQTKPSASALPTTSDSQLPGGVKASPLARRMADEKGIDLRRVSGSGPGGRVVKNDIELFLRSPQSQTKATPTAPPLPMIQSGPPPADKHVPLSRLRQAIGRRMTQSKQQFPHFYVTAEYDIASVMKERQQANEFLKSSDEKLSVNDFIVKAAALALRQFPNLNAVLAEDEVIQYGQINVGVAVAVENGLLTVVCQDADRKSIRQISIELKEKAERARQGRIQPEDVEGSTFSVSNLGMFDVDHFIAIINPPEAAILAVGSAKHVPIVENEKLTTGWRMKATISVDHRVSDGAEAAQFMQMLGKYLENPVSMLL